MNFLKIFYVIIAVLCFTCSAQAAKPKYKYKFDMNKLTRYQILILTMGYDEGKKIGYPETTQAILWHESGAGKKKMNPKDPSYGVGHCKVSTAQWLIRKHFKMKVFSNKELPKILMENDSFSIFLTTLYLDIAIKKFKKKKKNYWSHAVLSYNCGMGGVNKNGLSYDPNKYLSKIQWAIKNVIRPFNKQMKSRKMYQIKRLLLKKSKERDIKSIKKLKPVKKAPVKPVKVKKPIKKVAIIKDSSYYYYNPRFMEIRQPRLLTCL